jgi:ABC-2 type transport system permease protein
MRDMDITGGTPYQIHTEVKLLYNPTMKGAYSTVPGVMGMILMLICAMMSSISIAREKELGTMEVILVSPMPPLLIILSKMVPYFSISLINFTTVLLLAVFVLKVPIAGSLALLILVSIIYIFVSLAPGLLISSLVDSQIAALLFSVMGLIFPVVMLSGMMFPIENMPLILQGVAQMIPAKWYIVATRNIMIKGVGIGSIINELLVLSFMAVFLIALSLKKFKIRLE